MHNKYVRSIIAGGVAGIAVTALMMAKEEDFNTKNLMKKSRHWAKKMGIM